jgi:predicted transcriptional regulator
LNALDQIAAQTDRSRNWLVACAVEDFIALNAWQLGKIEGGIAAADAGEFASDEELARVRKKFAPSS